MKALRFFPIFFFLLATSLVAQTGNGKVIYVKAEKFTQPLVEKWIEEFSRTNTGVQIRIADAAQEADINLLVKSNETAEESNVIYVGRYALLPIANKAGSAVAELSKIKLNKKVIKELFFEKDPSESDNKKITKLKEYTTIYSGNKANSGSSFFASHFGYSASDLRDKRISGDDLYLLKAIERDPKGITINNLTYIYDLKTRNLKSGLALLPLDIKKEYSEVFASSDLDKTLDLLEKESIELVPVNKIGITYKESNLVVSDFLQWILVEGQRYNHDFGFLTLDKETYLAQKKSVENIYLTSHNTEKSF